MNKEWTKVTGYQLSAETGIYALERLFPIYKLDVTRLDCKFSKVYWMYSIIIESKISLHKLNWGLYLTGFEAVESKTHN